MSARARHVTDDRYARPQRYDGRGDHYNILLSLLLLLLLRRRIFAVGYHFRTRCRPLSQIFRSIHGPNANERLRNLFYLLW